MKNYTLFILMLVFLSACSLFNSLHSVTSIQPQQEFILGKNEHRNFKVHAKNLSNYQLEVHFAPITGGKHSFQLVGPNESVDLKVEKNTALIITNKSQDTINVSLKVKGDLGLSMGYQNK